jgi:hypothetical protein
VPGLVLAGSMGWWPSCAAGGPGAHERPERAGVACPPRRATRCLDSTITTGPASESRPGERVHATTARGTPQATAVRLGFRFLPVVEHCPPPFSGHRLSRLDSLDPLGETSVTCGAPGMPAGQGGELTPAASAVAHWPLPVTSARMTARSRCGLDFVGRPATQPGSAIDRLKHPHRGSSDRHRPNVTRPRRARGCGRPRNPQIGVQTLKPGSEKHRVPVSERRATLRGPR